MDFLGYLGAFGVGGIVTTYLTFILTERRERRRLAFNERKAAFVGLLEALQAAAVDASDRNSKAFAYWQARCKLIATEATCRAIQSIVDTNGDTNARPIAFEKLVDAMRRELAAYL